MVLNYYARNYSESLALACSPPELGGARGGLNKLFCRLPLPLFNYATKLLLFSETTKHFANYFC